jgi:DNA-binding IclR family transcriptional regulator
MIDRLDLPVTATQTSTRIIETLIELDGAGVTDIANALDRSKSSVHNHLETLTGLGFVVKDDYEYRVSLRFLQIGSYARSQYPIYTAGESEVDQLSTASGCSTGIAVLEGDSVVCLYHRPDLDTETPRVTAGDRLPLHCTAAGKAILAALSEARRDELLAGYTFDAGIEQSHSSRAELEAELQTIQTRGLAVDREEWYPDQRGIAAVVRGVDGEIQGAIYLLTDTERLSGKRFQQDLPGLVISSANKIRNTLRNP